MPTYAYACTECDHSMEVRQSFKDDALTTCPVCGGRLRKRFDNVGIVFKGSGFYRNDSRGNGPSGEAAAPAKASGDSGSSSEGSSGDKGTGSTGTGSGDSSGTAAPAPAAKTAPKATTAP